jgi:hypothetical protein
LVAAVAVSAAALAEVVSVEVVLAEAGNLKPYIYLNKNPFKHMFKGIFIWSLNSKKIIFSSYK